MTRKNRSDQEKKLGRRNVKYELQMLNAGVEAKVKHLCIPKEKRDAFIGSAFTDSILLHVRNLFDFFKHPSAKDYVRAKDFLQNKPWIPTKFKKIDNRLIKEINIYRSHISYSRKMGVEKPKWKVEELQEMRDEIFEVYEEFVAKLPALERPNWKIQNKNKINILCLNITS